MAKVRSQGAYEWEEWEMAQWWVCTVLQEPHDKGFC